MLPPSKQISLLPRNPSTVTSIKNPDPKTHVPSSAPPATAPHSPADSVPCFGVDPPQQSTPRPPPRLSARVLVFSMPWLGSALEEQPRRWFSLGLLHRGLSSATREINSFKITHRCCPRHGSSLRKLHGHGSFGAVYRGVLPDGRKVAVKLMDVAGKQGEQEFKMEVELLTRLRSPYLLGLVGYCSDGGHMLLVYEFMANGGLQEHLYPTPGSCGGVSKLDWEIRMKIALEAAKGLEYLHEHVTPPVIHRDFKSSNILLDKNFHARVSDFGLAKLGSDKAGGHVSTRVLGTQGYVAPEYALTGHLTTKSDVYSFGVVLLELLTGRVPVDMKRPTGEGVLVSWALPRLTDREKVAEIMDPAMEGQYSMKDAVQVAAIAAMCVQPEADYRPLMADVVQSLVPLVRHKSTAKVGSCSSFHSTQLSEMPPECGKASS